MMQPEPDQANDRREALSDTSPPLPLGTPRAVGPYQLVAYLGGGGMGNVFRAIDSRSGAIVAIKLIHPYLIDPTDTTFVELFRREADVAARLNTPYAVKTLAVVGDGRQIYLVSEYIDGGSLAVWLARAGRLLPRAAVTIAGQIALALVEAQRQGIVHRDIKPANILLQRDGVAKLADFGIARVADRATIISGRGFVGTPTYAAPEQHEGKADLRSDIYALGATLFEMLTGRVPYDGPTPIAVAQKHLYEPIPLAELAGLAPSVVTVVATCLAKQPADRYQTPAALVMALTQAQRDLTPAAAWRAPDAANETAGLVATLPLLAPPDAVGEVAEPADSVGEPTEAEAPPSAPAVADVAAPGGAAVATPGPAPMMAAGRVPRPRPSPVLLLMVIGGGLVTLASVALVGLVLLQGQPGPSPATATATAVLGTEVASAPAAVTTPSPAPSPAAALAATPTLIPPTPTRAPTAAPPPSASPPVPASSPTAGPPSPVSSPVPPSATPFGLATPANPLVPDLLVTPSPTAAAGITPAGTPTADPLDIFGTPTVVPGWPRPATATAGVPPVSPTTPAAPGSPATVVPTAPPPITPLPTRTPTPPVSEATARANRLLQQARLVFGPVSGSLEHRAGTVTVRRSGVAQRSPVIEARFTNPYAAADGLWAYGFGFRETSGGNHLRIVLSADGRWALIQVTRTDGRTDFQRLDSGRAEPLELGAGAVNLVQLVASEQTGYLLINRTLVATMDLSASLVVGDVYIGNAFYVDSDKPGSQTRYADFSVKALP